MTTVYVTHGRKYHVAADCPLMVNGEMLHDWDSWDDYGGGFVGGSYRRTETSPTSAAMCGKLPCLGCVPTADRRFPPLYGQTFGHEPAWMDGDAFCARCRDRGHDEYGDPWTYPTLWPCTSALVLGLASRAAE